jgi:hypothetical protein
MLAEVRGKRVEHFPLYPPDQIKPRSSRLRHFCRDGAGSIVDSISWMARTRLSHDVNHPTSLRWLLKSAMRPSIGRIILTRFEYFQDSAFCVADFNCKSELSEAEEEVGEGWVMLLSLPARKVVAREPGPLREVNHAGFLGLHSLEKYAD